MLALRFAIFALAASTRLFMPRRPVSPATPNTAARSGVPLMPLFDFGTANYKIPEDKQQGPRLFSLIAGDNKEKQPNKFAKPDQEASVGEIPIFGVNINLPALILAGAPLGLLLSFVLAIVVVAPGTQAPFKFLDRWNPPRQAELTQQKIKREKFEADVKAAADKAKKKAEEAAAAAEAEAKAKAAAAAKAPAAAAKAPAAAAKK
jgi:hypothetical protein